MQQFTKNVLHIIRSIPAGSVMTYGQVAEKAGNRRAARQVARILHSMSEAYGLPWHRVVNAKGEIAIKDELSRQIQKGLLVREGVAVDNQNRVDLDHFQAKLDMKGQGK